MSVFVHSQRRCNLRPTWAVDLVSMGLVVRTPLFHANVFWRKPKNPMKATGYNQQKSDATNDSYDGRS